MWENFTWDTALIGGALIGLSASMMLFFNGRIAGISGIAGGLISKTADDKTGRVIFVIGLLLGGVALPFLMDKPFDFELQHGGRSQIALIIAGLMVGFGTRLGSGCTSGHGVCGLSRFSFRSLVATMVFMAAGFGFVALLHFAVGGVI